MQNNCLKAIINVFENVDLQISESPPFWRYAEIPGFVWERPFKLCPRRNGVNQGLLDEPNERCLCILDKCKHKVDLYALGLTRKIMELQPSIHIIET